MNHDSIQSLIETNRYNIEILPTLEEWTQHQIKTNTYHLEANLTVLKFYQFYPDRTQKSIVAWILAKALMNLPATDFTFAIYMISETLVRTHHTQK